MWRIVDSQNGGYNASPLVAPVRGLRTWRSGETEWHINWKNEFDMSEQEISFVEHRADVVCGEYIIEFQNSPISVGDVAKRDAFYKSRGELFWVINVIPVVHNIRIFYPPQCISPKHENKQFVVFDWKHPKVYPKRIEGPLFLDMGDDVLQVDKVSDDGKSGRGWLVGRSDFVDAIKNKTILNKPEYNSKKFIGSYDCVVSRCFREI